MIVETITMHKHYGMGPVHIEVGQVVLVYFEGLGIPLEVTKVYPNGDFTGEVYWYEA